LHVQSNTTVPTAQVTVVPRTRNIVTAVPPGTTTRVNNETVIPPGATSKRSSHRVDTTGAINHSTIESTQIPLSTGTGIEPTVVTDGASDTQNTNPSSKTEATTSRNTNKGNSQDY